VAGVVGRESGEARLEVLRSAGAAELEELVHDHTCEGCVLYTDEWAGYDGVDRQRQSCRHTPGSREWARDDDGDGVREVHNNTCFGDVDRAAEFPAAVAGCEQVAPVGLRRRLPVGLQGQTGRGGIRPGPVRDKTQHRFRPMSLLECGGLRLALSRNYWLIKYEVIILIAA
jgi:hypothetical protein